MQEELKLAVLIREAHHLIVELQHQCLHLRRHDHHLLSFIHIMGEYPPPPPIVFTLKLLIIHASSS